MSKLKKPIIWTGDSDLMLPYNGVTVKDGEIEVDEDLAEEIAGSARGRDLTEEERGSSQRWAAYGRAKNGPPVDPDPPIDPAEQGGGGE